MRVIAEQLVDLLSGFFIVVCLMVPAIATFFVVRQFIHSLQRKRDRRKTPKQIFMAAPRRIIENRPHAAPKLAQSPLVSQKRGSAAATLKPRRNGYRICHGTVGVYGYALNEAPFHEEAFLLDVSPNGALLQLSVPVREGQDLLLTNDKMSEDRLCRIVHVSEPGTRPIEVAVEFPGPCPDFWRIFSRAESANGASSPVLPPSGDHPSTGGSMRV